MTVIYGYAAKVHLDDNYPEWLEIPAHEQVSCNHTTCEMGEDTRGRMNILNKGGAFLWHCFNCSDSGYYRPREYMSMLAPGPRGYSVIGTTIKDPLFGMGTVTDITKMSTAAKLWLSEYEMLDQAIVDYYHISETAAGSLVLPVWHEKEIVGTQTRNFGKLPRKYYTRATSPSAYITSTTEFLSPLFIVEDLLSAYKLHCAGASVWCLMGTSIKGEYVPANGAKVVLWLDSDLAGEVAAVKLAKELAPMYPTMTTMFDLQPKEVSFDRLRKLVRSV